MSPARILRAAWDGIKGRTGAVLWFAPWFLGAAVQGYQGTARMVAGEYAYGFTAVILAALMALWPVYDRYTFRQAWASGFAEGIFAPGHLAQGIIPDPLLRQTMTGDVAPEPWDRPTAPRPRHATKKE